MRHLGDFATGKTVRVRFNTHTSAGTPITLAGTPAISVYKGSTTESTAGVTLTVDYDSRTGLHDVVIDTSADGTFYAAGSDFDVVITAGTVDSVSVVGTVVGTFSLNNRSALRPTTADRTLAVDASNKAPATIAAGDIANSALTAAALDVDAVTEIQSGLASQASVDALAGYVDTEVAAIKAKTDNLPADPADASDIAASFSSLASTLTTIAGYIDTEVAAIKAKTDNLPAAPASVGDLTTALTTALTEGYRGTGATGSVRDLLYEINQSLNDFAIASTTKTVKKIDGTTTAKTYTLNSATAPTSITEAT